MKKFFKRIGRGIKKIGKKIAKGFKTAFKSIGEFFSKLGPIGSMALMFVAPYLLAPLKAGMGAATGLGATGKTVAGVASKSVSKAAVLGSKSGVSKAVASTMFEVGKAFGTVSKTVTGGIEGIFNTLGGGNFTANSLTGATGGGPQIGSKITQGIDNFFGRVDKTASGKSPVDAGQVEREILSEKQVAPSKADIDLFEQGPKIKEIDLPKQPDFLDEDFRARKASFDPNFRRVDITRATADPTDWDYVPDPEVKTATALDESVQRAMNPTLQKKNIQDSLLAAKGRVEDYVSSLPSNLIERPFATVSDVVNKVATVQQVANWISPQDLPSYGGGSTAKYLAESNLLQGNIDYVNMMPEQLGEQDLVHTSLLPESSTLDATVYDVLGRNMYYAFS